MLKYIIPFIIGVIVTIVVIKLIKKKVESGEITTKQNFIELAKTPQFKSFILSPQGKELAKTPQFKKLIEGATLETIAKLL